MFIYYNVNKFFCRNIFLQNGHAKIGDFGLAKTMNTEFMYTLAGTYSYMSPEMISSIGYGLQTDIW